MRRIVALFISLLPAAVLAQISPTKVVTVRASCSGSCTNPTGEVLYCLDRDDGAISKCNGTSWERADVQPCPTDPPSGSCSGAPLCQSASASGALYGCVSGTWTKLPAGAASDVSCADCIALGSETSGNYAAGDAEAGNATGVACTDCVTLGTETVGNYAAGDAEGGNATGVACTDCVALGAETTGNYAAGDAEGGNATGVSCTDCVTLGTETTGNYAGSDSEGGLATGVKTTSSAIIVSGGDTAVANVGTSVEIGPRGAQRPPIAVHGGGAVLNRMAFALYPDVPIRATAWAFDFDGLMNDPAPFLDQNDDGVWQPDRELLLVPDFLVVRDSEDCATGTLPDGHAGIVNGAVPSTLAQATVYGLPYTTWDRNTGNGLCRVRPDPAASDTFSIVNVGSTASTNAANSATIKMVLFKARVGSDPDMSADPGGRAFVGGLKTSTSGNLSAVTDLIAFVCDPYGDPDGDDTSHDGTEDDNWWAVVESGFSSNCRQYADGDDDKLLDCDLDGTEDTIKSHVAVVGFDTGFECATTYTYYYQMAIERDGNGFRFLIVNYQRSKKWSRRIAGYPPSAVGPWAVAVYDNDATTRAELWVDKISYMGLP